MHALCRTFILNNGVHVNSRAGHQGLVQRSELAARCARVACAARCTVSHASAIGMLLQLVAAHALPDQERLQRALWLLRGVRESLDGLSHSSREPTRVAGQRPHAAAGAVLLALQSDVRRLTGIIFPWFGAAEPVATKQGCGEACPNSSGWRWHVFPQPTTEGPRGQSAGGRKNEGTSVSFASQ